MMRIFRVIFTLLLIVNVQHLRAQLNVSANPAIQNGTVFLCLDDGNTITFTASYTGASDSIIWNFSGGNSTGASGSGKSGGTGSHAWDRCPALRGTKLSLLWQHCTECH